LPGAGHEIVRSKWGRRLAADTHQKIACLRTLMRRIRLSPTSCSRKRNTDSQSAPKQVPARCRSALHTVWRNVGEFAISGASRTTGFASAGISRQSENVSCIVRFRYAISPWKDCHAVSFHAVAIALLTSADCAHIVWRVMCGAAE
jgi:hypothetical protein